MYAQREFGSAPSSLFFVKTARMAHLWLTGKNPCDMAAMPARI